MPCAERASDPRAPLAVLFKEIRRRGLTRLTRHGASGVPRQESKLRFSRLRNPLRHDLMKAPHRDQVAPPHPDATNRPRCYVVLHSALADTEQPCGLAPTLPAAGSCGQVPPVYGTVVENLLARRHLVEFPTCRERRFSGLGTDLPTWLHWQDRETYCTMLIVAACLLGWYSQCCHTLDM
jgi:hypothetical protein